MPPLRRPSGTARAPRRWAPLAIAACLRRRARGRRRRGDRAPAGAEPDAGRDDARSGAEDGCRVVDTVQDIRLDGQLIGKGSNAVFSPDGRSVAFQSDGVDGLAVRIYDGDTGEIATVLETGGMYVHPWSPDGRLLAVSAWDGVHVVDRSGRAIMTATDRAGDAIFSPDSSQIAYPTPAGVATVAVTGGESTIVLSRRLETAPIVRPIAWRADGLVVLDGREIIVTGTGRRIPLPGEPLDEGIAPIPIVASADGRIVAFTSFLTTGSATAYVVDTDTGRIRTVPGSVEGLTPDGSSVLVASQACAGTSTGDENDRSLTVLDVATLATRQTHRRRVHRGDRDRP